MQVEMLKQGVEYAVKVNYKDEGGQTRYATIAAYVTAVIGRRKVGQRGPERATNSVAVLKVRDGEDTVPGKDFVVEPEAVLGLAEEYEALKAEKQAAQEAKRLADAKRKADHDAIMAILSGIPDMPERGVTGSSWYNDVTIRAEAFPALLAWLQMLSATTPVAMRVPN